MKQAGRRPAVIAGTAAAAALGLTFALAQPSWGSGAAAAPAQPGPGGRVLLGDWGSGSATTTPIKHLVVIFDENVSFDHYFGTYPNAANTGGTKFTAKPGTPAVDGLTTSLLNNNPNGLNPKRLTPAQALTCDQGHGYDAEQKAYDNGLVDKFPQYTQTESCSAPDQGVPGLVMDYYDGNTVTAMWNYAQNYAMSDNSYDTTYGPSTPGALNLISGQTHGGYAVNAAGQKISGASFLGTVGANGIGTDVRDTDPAFDDCSNNSDHLAMTGKNVGDLLNGKGVSWGWFQGGFGATTAATATSKAVCGQSHANVGGATIPDYSPHHEPFQYYASTANPHHTAPASVNEVGHNGAANHQYDLSYFYKAINADKLPAVSFVKQAMYQDGHAGYSDPTDEQHGLVSLINALEKSKDWKNTAVVIAYDDSDGWYDHVAPPNVNSSSDANWDFANGAGACNTQSRLPLAGYQDRCGYGPRTPLLVISPYSKANYVDHSVTDQSSILKFVEDNWKTGQIGDGSFDAVAGPLNSMFDFGKRDADRIILDPSSGAVLRD
ncbi:alkaline phosphatase family protein [Actinocrinis puniceicyclus]|uniref:phospholipase C n=1 Tax=Actinocrinis puniceicyclus TaxID=977794 RepID=A0A8J8BCK7_9ACTN|nr:alkaline phosphatase family protein [Actinocrinis puniceicyclus]